MNNRYKTLFLTTFLLLTIPAFAVPITTIGILCTDVNSVPECTVEVTMLTSGGFYVLDNPSKGMHECELPTEPRYSGNRRYDPIQKRQWLVVGKQTIENVDVIDPAGTGYSFGIGIVGVFEEVKITVNEMEYTYKGDTREYYKWCAFLSYLNGEIAEEIIS
ncbi:MAG: hypothetical protein KAH05_01955, partial [Clostridiales bacterium]|nr:hypothetical protein [Clostridiales bacterium]